MTLSVCVILFHFIVKFLIAFWIARRYLEALMEVISMLSVLSYNGMQILRERPMK